MRQLPDRAEVNSAIVRCRARIVPQRTVNERLNERLPAIAMWRTPFTRLRPAWPSAFNYYSEAICGQISEIMSAQRPHSSEMAVAAIPMGLRILAVFLRTV